MTDIPTVEGVGDELIFLSFVRRMKHIGYGRMIQIIAYEWESVTPGRGAIDRNISEEEIRAAMDADPIGFMWRQEGKG